MSPLVQKILGSIIRHGLSGLTVWMVAHGWLNGDEAMAWVEALAPGLVAIIWAIYQKYRQEQ